MGRKIVFFDIDGTLLDEQKQLPLSTIEAVRRLKQSGVYVAIATGRDWHGRAGLAIVGYGLVTNEASAP